MNSYAEADAIHAAKLLARKKPSERPLCINCRWHELRDPPKSPMEDHLCRAEFSPVTGERGFFELFCFDAREGLYARCGLDGNNFESIPPTPG